MKTLLRLALVATLTAGAAFAVETCPPPPCPPVVSCPPAPCPPRYKWVEVCETIEVPVRVTEYVEVPCEISVTRMVPCEKEVPTIERRWITETRIVPYTDRVWECEEYTAMQTRVEYREEIRHKKVWKTVCEMEDRVVTREVAEEVCDPATGKPRKVWRTVCETVSVPVKRRVCEEVEYTAKVPCTVREPVVKTRKIARAGRREREVEVRKCIETPSTKIVTSMVPVVEKQTVMRKKAVSATKMVEKQVVKKVRVPVEPGC